MVHLSGVPKKGRATSNKRKKRRKKKGKSRKKGQKKNVKVRGGRGGNLHICGMLRKLPRRAHMKGEKVGRILWAPAYPR